jgi:hypothetical protein
MLGFYIITMVATKTDTEYKGDGIINNQSIDVRTEGVYAQSRDEAVGCGMGILKTNRPYAKGWTQHDVNAFEICPQQITEIYKKIVLKEK